MHAAYRLLPAAACLISAAAGYLSRDVVDRCDQPPPAVAPAPEVPDPAPPQIRPRLVAGKQGMQLVPHLLLACRVTEVYDGDTVTVLGLVKARVRLRDCWAAEIRTTDPVEKAFGLEAQQLLQTTAENRAGMLHVSLEEERLDGLFTFGRLVGDVLVDGQSISDLLVERGKAFRTKAELEAALAARRGK